MMGAATPASATRSPEAVLADLRTLCQRRLHERLAFGVTHLPVARVHEWFASASPTVTVAEVLALLNATDREQSS